MKSTFFFVLFVLSLLTQTSLAQSSYGKPVLYFFGAQYSKDYNTFDIVDEKHNVIDTNLHLGLNDSNYVRLRKRNDLPAWSEHFAFKFGYSLSPILFFETGLSYFKGGVKVRPNYMNDSILGSIFSNIQTKSEYIVDYNVLEVPLTLRLKPNLSDKKSRFFPILSAGVGIGYGTQELFYYNYIENSKIERNFGLTANIGLGLRREIDNAMYFEINSFYRRTLINHFAYAPVQTNFQSFGVEATLGWLIKGKALKRSNLILSCKDFSEKYFRRFNIGMHYGGLYTFAINNGANKELLSLFGHPQDTSTIRSYTSNVSGLPGYSIGLYVEFKLNQIFSIGYMPAYTQRGFTFSDHFTYKDSTSKLLEGTCRFNYLDIPLEFTYSPINKMKVFAGGMFAVFMKDHMSEFIYAPSGYVGAPLDVDGISGYSRILRYFGQKPRDVIWGAHIGASYDIDNRLALLLKAQYSSNMMGYKQDELSIGNIALQASIVFYLNKYGFQSGSASSRR